ncbi:MAG: hypothetical protein ISR65_17530 [Bacteriovoracaceae bacterium]|nr:hypothetical protein [Bacteriovoracaceae bacterium]
MTTTIKKVEKKNDEQSEFVERVLKGGKAALFTFGQGFLFGAGTLVANRLLSNKLVDQHSTNASDNESVLKFDRKASNA